VGRYRRGHEGFAEELEQSTEPCGRVSRDDEPLRGAAGGDAVPLGGFLAHQPQRRERLELAPDGWVAGVTHLPQLRDRRSFQLTQTL
jgi:hypothetical protein